MSEQRPPTEQMDIELDLPPGQEAEEGTVDRRRINTPSRQGSSIPTGWKPTIHKPVPVVRCHHVFPDADPQDRGGNRCNRWSLRGSQLCYIHSGRGNLRNVETYRKAIIESARLQLTESVPDALATIFDLAANSTADNVKLKAATEILDRAGLKAAEELNVNLEVSAANPAVALTQRLEKLRKAAEISAEMQRMNESAEAEQLALAAPPLPEPEVIEGEVDGGDSAVH